MIGPPPSIQLAARDLKPYEKQFDGMKHELGIFMNTVGNWFADHPELIGGRPPAIHSVRSRLKSNATLREKIKRKYVQNGKVIFQPSELGTFVTDLSGVRVLHLHQRQLADIARVLNDKLQSEDWHEVERKAFTWDPESAIYLRSLNFDPEVRDTFYTSVHYVIRPNANSPFVCEIQIRTLFEEIWGEIDHTLNYPQPTKVRSEREQLRVLSKLVGAGSRLLDSIFCED